MAAANLSDLPWQDEWEPPSKENGESSSEDEGKLDDSGSEDEQQTNLQNGRSIGSLFVSRVEIGMGSNGTIVFQGTYGKRDGEKRPVAVKRLVKGHHHLASKEIESLIASDKHPNILRYFTKEEDRDFVYLAVELCDFSLDDLIQAHSDYSNKPVFPREYKIKLDSVRDVMQDGELLKADRHPSPLLLKLMRDIVSGLVHLHQLGIFHWDLNPRNVLITKHPSLCAKLSDMGISKHLHLDKNYPPSSSGIRGWQAPERLLCSGHQTCKMDMFNFGCVLFFCLTRGSHPFGRERARDINIEENKMDLSLVEFLPEAHDLISCLLNRQPELRPNASEVLCHPFWWSSKRRLSFLCDLSNRLQMEKRANSDLLKALQNTARVVFSGRWTDKIETEVMDHLNEYRTYNGCHVQDLLRAVRNESIHLREGPEKVQEIVGSVPEDVEAYFAKRFPGLLMESYKVAFQFCEKEDWFQKFFLSDQLLDVLTL